MPASIKQRAHEELGETPSVRAEALAQLKAALAARVEGREEALTEAERQDLQRALHQSDPWLLRFLRVRRFDATKALVSLRSNLELGRYYTALPASTGGRYNTRVPRPPTSMFEMGLDHPAVRYVTEVGVARVLPGRAYDGSAVFVLRLSDRYLQAWSEMPVGEFSMAVDKLCEAVSLDAQTQLLGITMIVDFRKASAGLITTSCRADMVRLNERRAKLLSGHAGFRTRALWMVGVPWYGRAFVNVARAFMPAKIRARVRVASDAQQLRQCVAPSLLAVGEDEPADFAACLRALRRTHHSATQQ